MDKLDTNHAYYAWWNKRQAWKYLQEIEDYKMWLNQFEKEVNGTSRNTKSHNWNFKMQWKKSICMYNWITLLYTWNWHSVINQLYFNSSFLNKMQQKIRFSKRDNLWTSRWIRNKQQKTAQRDQKTENTEWKLRRHRKRMAYH